MSAPASFAAAPRGTVVPQPSARLRRALLATAAGGALVFLLGATLDPARAWGGYLLAFTIFVELALAGPLFLAIVHLTGARWAYPLRRVPQALGAALPAALLLGVLLVAGTSALYEWSHAATVAQDELLQHKAPWLNVPGFALRLLACFAAWILLARRLSARVDARDAEPEHGRRDLRGSALFLAVFAVTFSVASVDWIQSLDPHWFSTIFALRTLSGLGCAGVAACTLVLVALRRRGWRAVVTRDVLDDLGKIQLGLALLWAYVWYCEYMIIWYSNLPEETGYFLRRTAGDWGTLVPVNLAAGFGVPFLCLLLRPWRRSATVLARIAAWVLVAHALDRYLMIAPAVDPEGPRIGVLELAPLVGALALFAWILLRALASRPLEAPAPTRPA